MVCQCIRLQICKARDRSQLSNGGRGVTFSCHILMLIPETVHKYR